MANEIFKYRNWRGDNSLETFMIGRKKNNFRTIFIYADIFFPVRKNDLFSHVNLLIQLFIYMSWNDGYFFPILDCNSVQSLIVLSLKLF